MNLFTIAAANKIYKKCETAKLVRYGIKHTEFMHYCISLERFIHELGEMTAHDYWKPFLGFFKRSRYRMCSVPLPFNHPALHEAELCKPLERDLRLCTSIYPEFAVKANELFSKYVKLSHSTGNPFLNFIAERWMSATGKETALLIRDSHLVTDLERIVKADPGLHDVEVVVPEMLKKDLCYQRLITVGPARWFPEYIFTSPHANEIHVVHYSWIKDGWEAGPAFIASDGKVGRIISFTEQGVDIEGHEAEDFLEVEAIVPAIDIEAAAEKIRSGSEHEIEELEARAYMLEGGVLVFLDKNSKELVIDLQGAGESKDEEESQVKRIPVPEIETGMFILLRTSGGGDYIIPVADKILGSHAEHSRIMQKKWKGLLREAVRTHGLLKVCINLIDLGSERANEVNVRNWMSERSIKPDSYEDFEAIMNLIGLGDKTSEYWKNARIIDSAHRRAGFYIRKLLLKQVLSADLRKLEKAGEIDFELPEAEGGILTAFRIKEVGQGIYKIPSNRIGRIARES